ncbi:MAG: septal ring lytic transglycosylase RlpA family protein [Pseudomonadota bacterium]
MKTVLTAIALSLALIAPAAAQTGSASWYALDGNMTASGERMNSSKMTAAHRKLPFGTKIKVTNMHNKRSVVVRINDRGPFAKGRILDVSKAAARKLGFVSRGHARVRIERVFPQHDGRYSAPLAAAGETHSSGNTNKKARHWRDEPSYRVERAVQQLDFS